MDTHKNARLTPKGREQMVRAVVDGGLSKAAAARQFNTTRRRSPNGSRASARTASMVCVTDPHGLFHRQAKSRKPHATRSRVCAASAHTGNRSRPKLAYLQSDRMPRPQTARSQQAQRPGAAPTRPRYEREQPGESSISISKSSAVIESGTASQAIRRRQESYRGIGWEFVHVCIDDPSRVAFVQVIADQRKESAVAFLEAAVA